MTPLTYTLKSDSCQKWTFWNFPKKRSSPLSPPERERDFFITISFHLCVCHLSHSDIVIPALAILILFLSFTWLFLFILSLLSFLPLDGERKVADPVLVAVTTTTIMAHGALGVAGDKVERNNWQESWLNFIQFVAQEMIFCLFVDTQLLWVIFEHASYYSKLYYLFF